MLVRNVCLILTMILLNLSYAKANNAFLEEHLKLLKVLHGDPTPILPSPALCSNSTSPTLKKDNDFYFGKAGCKRNYEPDYASLITPLTEGGRIKQFIYDEKKYSAAIEAISSMTSRAEKEHLSVKEKIDVQLTLWNLITALQYSRDFTRSPPYDQSRIDGLIKSGLLLIDKVLLSKEELAGISDSYDAFNMKSENTDVANLYLQLSKGEGYFVEDIFPWLLHSQAGSGTIYERIFIGFDKKDSFDSFGKFLADRDKEKTPLIDVFGRHDQFQDKEKLVESTPVVNLDNLQKNYSHLHTVLVTYLNVIDQNHTFVPTGIIAKWAEVWFQTTVDSEKDKLEDVDSNIFFRVIEYQKSLPGKTDKAYKTLDMQSIARRTFLNVNPNHPDIKATTLRGNCLSCHLYVVRDFHVHKRFVGFSKPFALPFSHYQKYREYGEIAEKRLREWSKAYIH